MEHYRKIDPRDMGNAVSLIGDQWTLITAAKQDGSVNTMTASWGFLGVLWNKPVCAVFIRPQRHTLGFVEEADTLTLTFFDETHREALKLCGTKSGRDCDKIAEAGLTLARLPDGTPYFQQARTVALCRKLYVDDLKPEGFLDPALATKNYPRSDYHRVFICELEQVWERE